MAKDCLPTIINLGTKGVMVPPTCPRCPNDLEKAWHVFLNCPNAQDCGKEACMSNIIYHYVDVAENFVNWLFQVITEVSGVDVGRLSMIP